MSGAVARRVAALEAARTARALAGAITRAYSVGVLEERVAALEAATTTEGGAA